MHVYTEFLARYPERFARVFDAIANNKAKPTFENTIVALEKSGAMLTRVSQAFSAVTGANTNDTLDRTQSDEAPKLAAHEDEGVPASVDLLREAWAEADAILRGEADLGWD